MAYKAFYETLPWQKTQLLVTAAQSALQDCEQQWFKDQLLEAACKAALQVAEGYERYGDNELIKYLGYAKDNLVKCRALLAMAPQLEVMDADDIQHLEEKTSDASKVIYGLSKYLRNKLKVAA
jgi:four helix bundle protein